MEKKMKAYQDKRTVSLQMIVKDEVKEITELVRQAKPYFDAIYLTVSDEKAYKIIKNLADSIVKVDHRPWNNKFDDARNHNWDKGAKYDASFWLDADDRFPFERMPELMAQLDEYDVVFLPYHYDHDEDGNLIVSHWRERLIKRDKGFYWKGWVHENLITDEHFIKVNVSIPIVHVTKAGHKDNSAERNHKILEEAYLATKDPRYIHYLGISFFTLKRFEEAIEILKEYCKVGGWDEEIYRSLIKMAEASHMLDRYDDSIQYALQAVATMPHYPMAYEVLAHFEFQNKNYKEALEYIKMGLQKPYPDSASIFDPTSKDRSILTGALCEFQLANYVEAYELLQKVKNTDVTDISETFKQEADIEKLKAVLPLVINHSKDKKFTWENLREDIKYRGEFRKIREAVTLPKKWDDDTVVFFCGKGYEEWGPHTLDKGMGGSEEAIVYLAPELVKLGYKVTVFGEVEKPFTQDGVEWKHWTIMDRRDYFNIMVIWRVPVFASHFKAKKTFIDMHDLTPSEMVKPMDNVTYLFKTQYHKDQYPQITDYLIIPNGIVTNQFNKTIEKKPYSVIYPSAYYRGLECLVDMWADIKKEVPEATLDIYYGWQSWTANQGEDAFYVRMNEKLEKAKELGVTEHGRVSHEVLAEKYLESKVWAYPTEFPEIFCITAVKANLAGCKSVITDVAALKETGGPSASIIETDTIYTNEFNKKQFVKAMVKALKEEHDLTEQKDWAKKFAWENVAEQWKDAFNG